MSAALKGPFLCCGRGSMLPLLIMRAGLGTCFTNFQPRVNTVTEFNFTVAPTQFDIMLPEICTVFTDMVLLIHILTSFLIAFTMTTALFRSEAKRTDGMQLIA